MFDEKSFSQPGAPVFRKRSLRDISLEPTRHGALKRVLIRHEEVSTHLMFLNEVYVSPGESVASHMHADMEEVFYFLDGEGMMQIEGEVQPVTRGDRVIVPMKTVHVIENTGDSEMRFICFGVKVLPED
jgi:mannose-6-phosphate isomerase-like protein (cupin superfamily)